MWIGNPKIWNLELLFHAIYLLVRIWIARLFKSDDDRSSKTFQSYWRCLHKSDSSVFKNHPGQRRLHAMISLGQFRPLLLISHN